MQGQDSLPFVGPAKAAVLAGLVAERAPALAVEVGALAGYSALTIAKALPPGGRLISIESDWKWALVAKRFVWQAAQGEKRGKAVRPSQHALAQQCFHSACQSFQRAACKLRASARAHGPHARLMRRCACRMPSPSISDLRMFRRARLAEHIGQMRMAMFLTVCIALCYIACARLVPGGGPHGPHGRVVGRRAAAAARPPG